MGRWSGFGVTLRQVFGRRVTTEYPEEKRPKPVRFHGRHVLNRYEDGMEKCIGCELCAGVCPARCIFVRGADNPPDDPVSPGERYGFIYEINYLRCIHCDLCVEACPTEAITETKLFEYSFANRRDAIYTREDLLVDDEGRAKRLPWEHWIGWEDDATSGWVRATASSGNVEYEGEPGWSPELGFGLRPPEQGQRPSDEVPGDAGGGAGTASSSSGGVGPGGADSKSSADAPPAPPSTISAGGSAAASDSSSGRDDAAGEQPGASGDGGGEQPGASEDGGGERPSEDPLGEQEESESTGAERGEGERFDPKAGPPGHEADAASDEEPGDGAGGDEEGRA